MTTCRRATATSCCMTRRSNRPPGSCGSRRCCSPSWRSMSSSAWPAAERCPHRRTPNVSGRGGSLRTRLDGDISCRGCAWHPCDPRRRGGFPSIGSCRCRESERRIRGQASGVEAGKPPSKGSGRRKRRFSKRNSPSITSTSRPGPSCVSSRRRRDIPCWHCGSGVRARSRCLSGCTRSGVSRTRRCSPARRRSYAATTRHNCSGWRASSAGGSNAPPRT